MDSKFNSWPNNDPTDSFTSVLIDASMKVPPHMHSCFIQPVLISLCVPFLIPWHRDMSVGRSPSLRMLECPPVQGSVEVQSHRNFVRRNSYNYRACGALRGEYYADSRVKFFACITAPSQVACPHFPPLPRLSVYCIHGELRDIALKTRLVIIRRNLLSLLNFNVKTVRIVTWRAPGQATECLRTEERKIA